MGTCRICGKNFGLMGGYNEQATGEFLTVCVDCQRRFNQIAKEEDCTKAEIVIDDLIASCNNEKTLPILQN